MLPTTYRGSATVAGEQLDAVLRLDEGHLRLATGHNAELLSWPIVDLSVETTDDGNYLVQAGDESFIFSPEVDDGLGHEIALRARFATPGPGAEPEAASMTVADRARVNGHLRRRPSLLSGADLGIRTAIVVMAALALVVVAVAVFSGRLDPGPAVVAVGDSPAPLATLPFTDDGATTPSVVDRETTVPGVPDPAPTTIQDPGPTTTAPEVAPVTIQTTTAAPTTTVPPTAPAVTAGVFELTPAEAVGQWDAVATELGTGLIATAVTIEEGTFSFNVGNVVVIRGTAEPAGRVTSIEFLGDPGGSVADDRAVLTALGLTVALIEPTFPPQWRRDLLEAMGLDVDQPVLAGLDGSLTHEGTAYAIRWDGELERLVFEASPA
jgi:hypothetical protein